MSVCKNLEDLQSNAAIHSWAETERALILSFGAEWERSLTIVAGSSADCLSTDFCPAVLGSGCVAQVLLGQLDGEQVAVKIIHPGKSEVNIHGLIRILYLLRNLLSFALLESFSKLNYFINEKASEMPLRLT